MKIYRIDHEGNDWDQLGVIDSDGESIGNLLLVTIDYEAMTQAHYDEFGHRMSVEEAKRLFDAAVGESQT